MTEASKREIRELEEKANVKISSPKTRKGKYRYCDRATNVPISLEEYERRYRAYILLQQQPCESNKKTTEQEQQQQLLAGSTDVDTCIEEFSSDLKKAEELLFKSFDEALQQFHNSKEYLMARSIDHMKKQANVDETIAREMVEKVCKRLIESNQKQVVKPEKEKEKVVKKKKRSKSSRRRSICFDDMAELVEED